MKRLLKFLLPTVGLSILFGAVLLQGKAALVAQDKKDTTIDWQKLLADLRERFAKSGNPTLPQTRIDRAYFSLNEDDPDQPPFLNFKGVCLRTAVLDEKQMKDTLRKELSKIALPDTVKYVLKIDGIAFHESPIYALQKAAVESFRANATFNNFFERASYAADGSLEFHVVCLRYDESTQGKLGKLLADHPIAEELMRLPGDMKTKAPTIVRRDHDWLGQRLEKQRQFAGSADPLLQRTRLDDGYLDYSKDRKTVQFHVDGVCIHPPSLVTEPERSKRWQAQVSNLIPKVTYEPIVTGIAMLPNPSIAWQDEAASHESRDGVFFHLGQFDPQGRVRFAVKLPADTHKPAALKLIAQKPVPVKLAPLDEKNIDFQTWDWQGVLPKAQKHLSEGDFLQHRTRVDRAFLKYDDAPNGIPYLHFDGVCLHPTEVEPADKQRPRLERALTDLPPAALEHKLNSEAIRFVTSPIYALQSEAVARGLDGMLFADGRYDAQGKLHLVIMTGTPGQKATARKMVAESKMPAGVIRAKDAKDEPILDISELAWQETLQQMQRWLSRHSETLLRKSRLDRAFFSYPKNKLGPEVNMALVGIYPNKDAYKDKLHRRLDAYVQLSLADQLRAGPVTVAPVIENIDNPATTVQVKVPEVPMLDGVRLDDASFDGDGKLILHGIWIDKRQQPALDKLIRETLTPAHIALKHGINWDTLQAFDSPALLHDLRVFITDREDIDEVWLERFYFDALGKVRVTGFATRAGDKDKAVKKLPDFLPRFDSKKLPGIDPDEAPMKKEVKKAAFIVLLQEPKDDGPIQLEMLPNIAQHLRDRIPMLTKCDGLRIDRCFYDPQGVFRIEGLADHAKHTAELKPIFDDDLVPFKRKRQLAKGWAEGRQIVVPLRPMMVSLHENLPSLPEFDGLTLTRAHHDPNNRLVLSGHAIGNPDAKELADTLKRLLGTHDRWQLRTKFGVVIDITDRKDADVKLARKLVYGALHLLQVNIGEARVDPLPESCIGWMSHAWPFDPKLPRVRPTDADYDKALEYLDAALLNDPHNVLAWYLRGYILQTKNRTDLTQRDFRRMVALEVEEEDLRHGRIVALELVQGRLRQSAYRIEQQAVIDVADGWTLRVLTESPAAPK